MPRPKKHTGAALRHQLNIVRRIMLVPLAGHFAAGVRGYMPVRPNVDGCHARQDRAVFLLVILAHVRRTVGNRRARRSGGPADHQSRADINAQRRNRCQGAGGKDFHRA